MWKYTRLDRECFIFRPKLVRRIVALGSASFLSQMSIVFSMAATLNVAVKYGARDEIFGQPDYAQIPTAVIGIVIKFFQIVISVSAGLATGGRDPCWISSFFDLPAVSAQIDHAFWRRERKHLLCPFCRLVHSLPTLFAAISLPEQGYYHFPSISGKSKRIIDAFHNS